jgi:flagellar FliL protein
MAETPAADASAGGGGKKMALVKLAGMSLIGLVAVADLGLRAVAYFKHPAPPAAAGPAKAGEGHDAPPAEHKAESKSTMDLDAFLVNLADKDSPRFVKATLRLGLGEPKLGEELAKESVALAMTRDAIISILSAKTSEELLTTEGKDALRKEIRARVNTVLPKGPVTDVYIVDFVIQL